MDYLCLVMLFCFYNNGKIHNSKNDSLVAKIQLSEPVDIVEDKYGNIVLLENSAIHIIDTGGKYFTYRDFREDIFMQSIWG